MSWRSDLAAINRCLRKHGEPQTTVTTASLRRKNSAARKAVARVLRWRRTRKNATKYRRYMRRYMREKRGLTRAANKQTSGLTGSGVN